MAPWPLAACQCPDGTPPPCAGARPSLPVLVVSPFENRSRDTADAYLAATLSEDVTAELAASHAVRVLNPRGNRRGAEYLLGGSVRREAHTMRVAARLERAGSGEIIWTTALDRPVVHGPEVAIDLAHQILARLGARSAAGDGGRSTARPVDAEVYQLYLEGRYYARRRNRGDIARGIELLQRAVTRDSTFALAWAEIAIDLEYVALWRIPLPGIPAESGLARQLDASTRALVLDSTNADIWVARAQALTSVAPTARTSAIRAYRRALALDSLNPRAWDLLGAALEEAGDSAAGHQALRRSVALDPTSAIHWFDLGLYHFYWNRLYDSAKVCADSAIAADPALISGHRLAATVALARGDWAEAEAQFEAARNIGPGAAERIWSLAGLAGAAAARGDSTRARALVSEMEPLVDTTWTNLHGAVFMAWAYAALGDRDRALRWLERYHPAADLHFQRHLRDGPLDPLRGEPRFERLIEETGPPGAR